MREPIQLAIAVSLCLCSPLAAFGQEKAEPKPTQFQETANSLLAGCGMQIMEYGFLPHFQSWHRMNREDFGPEHEKRFKGFPAELVKSVKDRKSANHEAAIRFLACYLSLARSQFELNPGEDLSLAAQRALAPDTVKLREGLVESLEAANSRLRLFAALSLLFLDESHARANDVFKSSVASSDPDSISVACRFIGLGDLASPQIVECLGRLLKHNDPEVRQAAAGAVTAIGPPAKALAPVLIELLDWGKDAEGSAWTRVSFLPEKGNFALLALGSMKEGAKPAVPAILARFPKSNDDDQLAMLSCLANAGSKDEASLSLVRNVMKGKKSELRLAAAYTLLHLAPEDQDATECCKQALADEKSKNLAIEMCQHFGPPSREIAATLIPLLNNKEEKVRSDGLHALASLGPSASEAVPPIIKLLAERDDLADPMGSVGDAAFALAKIRGKQASEALLHLFSDRNTYGSYFASRYLPLLGEELPPSTLEVLLGALKKGNTFAAFAICNLGERARPIRAELVRFLDDEAVGWIIDTALRRMGEEPK